MFKLIVMAIVSIALGTLSFRLSSKEIFQKNKAKINLLGVILYLIGAIIIVGIITNLVLGLIFKIVLIAVVIAIIFAIVVGVKKLK